MKFSYNKQEGVLAIWFTEGKYSKSEEVADGIILDRDKSGKVVGIEILDATRQTPDPFRAAILNHGLPVKYASRVA